MRSDPSNQRSTTVFGIALSELFILLLFLAILLWIATTPAKSDPADLRIVALEARVKELEQQLNKLQSENARLNEELQERDRLLKLLWQLYEKKPVTLTPGTPEWREWLKKWYADATRSQNYGGRGHPNCLGTRGGALMRLVITDSGLLAEPSEAENASAFIERVPAARQLIGLRSVSLQKFDELGTRILQWSEERQPPCRFDVIFVDKSTQKAPYVAALRAIDKVFYKTEHRG